MSKKDMKNKEEIAKSLASELGMSESEILDLISKGEEKEDSPEDKKEDEKEDETEEGKKKKKKEGREKDGESKEGFKPFEKKEDAAEKSQKDDILKSIAKSNKKLMKVIKKSQKSDLLKSLVSTIEELKSEMNLIKSQGSDIMKSVDTIGSVSQGTKGVRYSNFLEKGGDKPYQKGDKTVLSSQDRDSISEAMLNILEKSSDDDLKQTMSVDLINYQGSNQLSERAIKNLNKSGYIFREQSGE
jgi:hypothetical protein